MRFACLVVKQKRHVRCRIHRLVGGTRGDPAFGKAMRLEQQLRDALIDDEVRPAQNAAGKIAQRLRHHLDGGRGRELARPALDAVRIFSMIGVRPEEGGIQEASGLSGNPTLPSLRRIGASGRRKSAWPAIFTMPSGSQFSCPKKSMEIPSGSFLSRPSSSGGIYISSVRSKTIF